MRVKNLVITAGLLGLGITYGCEAGTNTTSTVPSLNWTSCEAQLGGRAVCADLNVPFSYKRPRLGSFTLKVAMQPAVNPSNRYLFVNLGGPGVVSTDSINGFPALNQNINIISFDPRGIGNTDIRLSNSPVLDCGTDEENLGVLAKPMYTPLDFDRAAWISRSRDYANNCIARNKNILPHVSTANVARDIDLLRQALGVPVISYYGVSYGTYLGATYAALFPDHYDAMVLDAPIDPDANAKNAFMMDGQAGGWTTGFERFFMGCLKNRKACQYFGGDATNITHDLMTADPQSKFDHLVDYYNATPGVTSDNQKVDGNDFILGSQSELYNVGHWPKLVAALVAAEGGNLDRIKNLSNQRYNMSGQHFLDAITAILAADVKPLPNAASLADEGYRSFEVFNYGYMLTGYTKLNIKLLQKMAPAQGAYYGPFRASSKAPTILVIGGRYDPATPYQFALKMTQTLGNARLLTNVSDGHGSYFGNSNCVATAVNNYFTQFQLPTVSKCADQINPFLKPTDLASGNVTQ